MGENDSRVPQLLALFASLSDHDKTETLKHLVDHQGDVTADLDESPKTDEAATISKSTNVHSCHVCKQLRFTKTTPPVADKMSSRKASFVPRVQANQLYMTKDLLLQGLSRQCLLVSWIFDFLGQSLAKLKSDIAQKGLLPSAKVRKDRLGVYTDDLEYISAEGVIVWLYVPTGEDGVARLKFYYEPNGYLVDQLWDSEDHHDGDVGYMRFVDNYNGSISVEVQISTTSGNPAMGSVPVRPSLRTTDAEDPFDAALRWFSECQSKHSMCLKRSGILPTRVIDVGTRFPIRSVRLHWSEESEEAEYAALSYCWGGQQPLTTTRATAQDFTDGIIFSKLPKTLQDAIIVTSKLGLRYIWIDALCILQDDPEDVAREISRMGQIFQEAIVTISAANAASVYDGFLAGRSLSREPLLQLPFEIPGTSSGSVLMERMHRTYNHVEDPINLRAWTLQEHILATRMLVFGAGELWWTCEGATTSGSRGFEHVNQLGVAQRKSDPYRFSLDHWRSIVRDYSRRFLTYPSDKLPAIAGVAAQYGNVFYGRYLAGLWEFGFLSELMWCSTRSDITRPLVQRAPSWSWASVDGEIHHSWCPLDLGEYSPQVLNCFVSHVSPASPYGSVDPTRSMLQISGDLARVYWHESRKYIYCTRPRQSWGSGLEAPPAESEEIIHVGRTQADALDALRAEDDRLVVWVFPIMKNPIRGLLLAHLGGDRFRRLGLVTRLWNEDLVVGRFEARTIMIS